MTGERLAREEKTVAAMVRLFCHAHHSSAVGLCPDCAALLDYARSRLARCPYGAAKPTCAKCPIHCYRPQERERIRAVMRYAGPRMLLRHPMLALLHLLDGLRSPSRCRNKETALY